MKLICKFRQFNEFTIQENNILRHKMILSYTCLGQGESVQINDLAPQFAEKERSVVSVYNMFKT